MMKKGEVWRMSGILVLYFSVYGTAERVAQEIARQTGAELQRIEPTVPYDSDRNHYDALSRRAFMECERDLCPAIKNALPVAAYDIIFLGYPIWWYALPMIVHTLLERYDFAGKTIVPFNTHMGSRDGGTWQLIRHLAPEAHVPDGLSVEMWDPETKVRGRVCEWLKGLNLTERLSAAI